jgi:hypothetical protein
MATNDRLTSCRISLLALAATGALVGAAQLGPGGSDAAGAARLGRSIEITPVSGRVSVAVGGHRPARLRSTRTIRAGSLVDATRGTLMIASTTRGSRRPVTADVTGGRFRVSLPGRRLTRLSLAPRAPRRCRQASAATIYRPGMKVRVPSRKRHRHARASAGGVGAFESVGRYQTAANDGAATWETSDTCKGTATTVSQEAGAVSTETHGPTSRPLGSLGASDSGSSARRTSRYRIARKVWTVACSRSGPPSVAGGYCEALLAEELSNGFVGYAPGLFARTATETFDLCITRPGAAEDCRVWPFSARASDGFRDGLIACTAPWRGEYGFRWSVDGVPLAAQLPPFEASRGSSFNSPCSGRFGAPFSPLGRWPEPLAPNAQGANRYVLPTAGALTSLSLYVIATHTSGAETIQGVVYGAAGGAPGPLMGATDRVSIRSGRDDGYQDLDFSPSLSLPAGAYWIGILTQGTPNVVFARYAHDAVEAYGPSLVPGVPNDPFGPFTTKHRRVSLLVDYDAVE